MKFKTLVYLTAVTIGLIVTSVAHAQVTPPGTVNTTAVNLPIQAVPAVLNLPSSLESQLSSLLPQTGQPFTLNGQTFVIETNASGGLTIITTGPAGTNTVTPPTTLAGATSRAEEFVNANNPANISYYSTNGEWDLSVGGVFAQNSGQAAAQLSIERYGVIKSLPNLSLGASVLEGNASGQSGTAGGYGFVDYRRPIGDVAFVAGLGAGYDNYNKSFMGVAKVEVEYRQNRHLGEYVGVGYAFEGIQNDRGLMIGGGIRYAF